MSNLSFLVSILNFLGVYNSFIIHFILGFHITIKSPNPEWRHDSTARDPPVTENEAPQPSLVVFFLSKKVKESLYALGKGLGDFRGGFQRFLSALRCHLKTTKDGDPL